VRLLLVDDHPELVELVARAFAADGHLVRTAPTAAEAERAMVDEPFDVIVLDPDGSGLELCRQARRAQLPTPILMLTAQTAVEQRVESLDSGADDFLGKPFALAELKARVRALGRRAALPAALSWSSQCVSLDFSRRLALVSGAEVPLTAKEWSILEVLLMSRGRVVPRGRLIDEVWGSAGEGAGSSLEVLVNRIRKKLGAEIIRTVRGEGYALG
jgi:DNA-binding response OmpR family regulator